MQGTVKWFNEEKKYGFIAPDNGGPDVFVHITQVKASGLQYLKEGAKLTYDTEPGRDGRDVAVDLRLISTGNKKHQD